MSFSKYLTVLCLACVSFIFQTGYVDTSYSQVPTVVAKPVNKINTKNDDSIAIFKPGSTVCVYVDPSATTDTKLGMADAISNWNQAGVVNLTMTNDPSHAQVRVANGQLHADQSIVFGLTRRYGTKTHITGDNITINADAINKYHSVNNMSIPEYTDMVCTHELGHALGLEHATPGTNSVMQPGTDRNIQPYDIQRLQMLYGQN